MNPFLIQGGCLVAYSGAGMDVTIPDEVVEIGEGAFRDNRLIRAVHLGANIRTIGKNAFQGCTELSSVTGLSRVVDFQDECFFGTGLEEVSLGRGVNNIGRSAFSCMPNLTTVNYYVEADLRLRYTFARCPKLETVNMERKCFAPFFCTYVAVLKNPQNKRPTFGDAFAGTPYIENTKKEYMDSYKKGICPDCGGKIKKGIFSSKCLGCGLYLKAAYWK